MKTVFSIPSDAALWEITGAIQVCQASGICDVEYLGDGEGTALLRAAGMLVQESSQATPLATAKAYRQMESAGSPYPDVLGRASGLESQQYGPPQFPGVNLDSGTSGIVFCPFEPFQTFQMPWTVWRNVVKHLRTYGLPVKLMGRKGQRADWGNFTEGDNLSDESVTDKLAELAHARLVLGVPNEWTWAAAAWGRKIIVMHPDNIPHERWFGFNVAPRTLGRLLYPSSQLQVPVILAGLRRLIDAM